jgi:ribonuclease HI
MGEPDVVIYTDGACAGNPGPGGWAAIVIEHDRGGMPRERVVVGGEPHTTNQRMELTAAIEGLAAVAGPRRVEVVSDSLYLVNCFRDRWWARWERSGWLNAARQPVANRDLWERLLAAVRPHTVGWRWVRGHDGDPLNERADQLAREAIRRAR